MRLRGENFKHCIGPVITTDCRYLDISAGEYELIKKARKNIVVLLGIEEKFEMVMENYFEYERDLLSLALRNMTRHHHTWASLRNAECLVNRRLANLLTVTRMYIDQTKLNIAKVYEAPSGTAKRICRSFSEQYDRLLGYRVMEATRNHIQHCSLPISSICYPVEWEDHKNKNEPLLRHCFTATLDVRRLKAQGKFKTKILEELEKAGSCPQDITTFVRQYVEGLSLVQEELRSVTHSEISEWSDILVGLLERYDSFAAIALMSSLHTK